MNIKTNIWRIKELPSTVYKIKTNLELSILKEKFNNNPYIKGWVNESGFVYSIGNKTHVEENFDEVESIEFTSLAENNKKGLLYQIIDRTFNEVGFNNIKFSRIFYFPKERDKRGLTKVFDNNKLFANYGFTYSLTQTQDKKNYLFLLSLEKVITLNGNDYDPDFANKNHQRLISEFKYDYRYIERCKNFEIFGTFFSEEKYPKSFIFDFQENGKILFYAPPLIKDKSKLYTFPEPVIDFGSGKSHTWSKVGLEKYNPLDYNESFTDRPNEINVIVIGTKKTYSFLEKLKKGEDEEKKYPFIGFDKIYKSNLIIDRNNFFELSDEEISNVSSNQDIINLLLQKVISLKNNKVKIGICIIELVKEWSNFFLNQETDIRDVLKIEFWKHRINSQVITENSYRNLDSSTLGNFALGIYFKVGGHPWRLKPKFENVAYIGISFGYSIKDKKRLIGLAEIFDTYGEFISLRCLTIKEIEKSEYFENDDCHLNQNQFENLLQTLVTDYLDSHDKIYPQHIVIHKTSYFNKEEVNIEKKFKDQPFDLSLVYLQNDHFLSLITEDKIEPPRGLFWEITKWKALLYTSGSINNGKYFLPGSPFPIQVRVCNESKFSIKEICEQIMNLTKLNFNSTNTYSREPVTILHSRGIVDLLRAGLEPSSIPEDPRYFI